MSLPAFLDTNVLYGSRLNDLLLHLAARDAFRPRWSADVLEELRRNLLKNGERPDSVEKRIRTMTDYFPDALVEGYDNLVGRMTCDPKDRHVLAAAVRANAEVLVTFDVGGFPTESVAQFEIEIVHPDDFLRDRLDLLPSLVTGVLEHLADVYENPPVTIDQLLRSLGRAGVPRFSQEAARYL